jgi:Fe2+ transport system protein FeoA
MTPIELGLHEGGDVDVVHNDVADEPGHVHVDEPRVDDLHSSQVAIAKGRASEVDIGELGASECGGGVVLVWHRDIVPRSAVSTRRCTRPELERQVSAADWLVLS